MSAFENHAREIAKRLTAAQRDCLLAAEADVQGDLFAPIQHRGFSGLVRHKLVIGMREASRRAPDLYGATTALGQTVLAIIKETP